MFDNLGFWCDNDEHKDREQRRCCYGNNDGEAGIGD